jgi:dihydrolipoamide dehydrogenase
VLVLGAGPGGYSAAFRAADLGLKTILVERYERLGGVCLNVGCIPSKALLHAARVISEAQEMGAHGIHFEQPHVDLDALRSWKQSVVDKLTGGLEGLPRQRKVEVVHGRRSSPALTASRSATARSRSTAASSPAAREQHRCRICPTTAASSRPRALEWSPAACWSSAADHRPEMATVNALGSQITVVEMLDQLLPGCDRDLTRPLGSTSRTLRRDPAGDQGRGDREPTTVCT